MNWGKGIIAGMVVFVLFILSLCFLMVRTPEDEYDHQYYEKGLNFDQEYKKEQQVKKDHAWPMLFASHRHIKITFDKAAKGQMRLIRPSSTSLDRVFNFTSGKDVEVDIPVTTLPAGKWSMELEWESTHKAYLYKQEIYIQ